MQNVISNQYIADRIDAVDSTNSIGGMASWY